MESVVDLLAADERVQAVLLTGSCARGVANRSSCVDVTILVSPDHHNAVASELPALEEQVSRLPAVAALQARVPWSAIDLDLSDGTFQPGYHGWTSGPDNYELEIGNILAWSHPLMQRGERLEALRGTYLPYYDESLRQERLSKVIGFARNNLDHVGPYALRDLPFQAFKRLYHALEEYLQALFIQRSVYPIAYDKWLREQLVDILGEPGIYEELIDIMSIQSLRVHRLVDRAVRLGRLVDDLDAPRRARPTNRPDSGETGELSQEA